MKMIITSRQKELLHKVLKEEVARLESHLCTNLFPSTRMRREEMNECKEAIKELEKIKKRCAHSRREQINEKRRTKRLLNNLKEDDVVVMGEPDGSREALYEAWFKEMYGHIGIIKRIVRDEEEPYVHVESIDVDFKVNDTREYGLYLSEFQKIGHL